MRGPDRTRTQPLAAVLVLASGPAGGCCGAALLVDDASFAGVTREWPASSLPRRELPRSKSRMVRCDRVSCRCGGANSPASPSAAAVNTTAEPSDTLRGSLRALRVLRGYPFSCGDRAATVSFPPPITGSSCRFAASDRTRRETNPRPCTRAAGTCWANQLRPGSRMSPRRETQVESAMGSSSAAPPIQLYLARMCPAPDFQLESFRRSDRIRCPSSPPPPPAASDKVQRPIDTCTSRARINRISFAA